MTETVPGRPFHLWTLSDVRDIIDGIRYVHVINKRDVYKWCADRILVKYGYVDLLSLHHRYVAFQEEQRKLMAGLRTLGKIRRPFELRRYRRMTPGERRHAIYTDDRAVYGFLPSYGREDETRV